MLKKKDAKTIVYLFINMLAADFIIVVLYFSVSSLMVKRWGRIAYTAIGLLVFYVTLYRVVWNAGFKDFSRSKGISGKEIFRKGFAMGRLPKFRLSFPISCFLSPLPSKGLTPFSIPSAILPICL